ncbi:hypothetical protein R3W88_016281 [Solanum pinnatisectum]|uniref:Integrase core domain containing protein n=1 Tax=Solanum pinnatisectum TaxID=50273 RepID=A0AAV9KYB1_9SOLN|nr:hypothetical protein R3W88_016281 [Solanum pinnatisectum]
MEQMMDQKIQAVHKCLDAFELTVLKSPAPIIDVSTFKTELANLHADVDGFLAPSDIAPEVAPAAEEDEMVMTDLFRDDMPPLVSSRAARKRHHSNHTSDTDEARRLKIKEFQQFEVAQRESILDEDMRQQRAREIDSGPSGLRSTTNGVPIVGKGATDGIPSVDPVSSGKLDPPTT